MSSVRFTCRGFAKFLLGSIEQPSATSDGGVTTRRRVIEILEAAGYSAAAGQALITAWLDGGGEDALLQAMTAGIEVLQRQGCFGST